MLRNIGKALAMIRRQRGLSQYALASRCKMGRSQISKYEAGREIMKLDTLDRLLSALHLDPEKFFGFMRSLDESVGTQRPARGRRADQPVLDEAFENLRLAIDKLQQAVELSPRSAAPRLPTPVAELPPSASTSLRPLAPG
jgi:transcriptional regulator with XRE-family HTH domain